MFSEKLSNHEVPVRGDLWSGIQSQLANTSATTTVVSKGISSSLKWMIGVASSVAVVGTTAWIFSTNETEKIESKVQLSQDSPSKTEQKDSILVMNDSKPTFKAVSKNQIDATLIQTGNQTVNIEQSIPKVNEIFGFHLLENQPAESKDETIQTTNHNLIAEEKVVASNTNTSAVPNETKSYEDGKIEEFVNVFTPNGDGMNDYFFLKNENLKDFNIRIINEKNEVVFESSDKDFKWFGLDSSGNMVQPGNYGYVIFATDLNGKPIKMFKNLMIK